MFSLISFRVYAMIAAFVALVLFLITEFASDPLVGFFQTARNDAMSAGLPRVGADMIVQPIILAISEPIAAVIAGVMWPLLLLWFFLIVLLFLFAFLAPLVSQATCAIRPC
jgi:hypothetical protein